jgi:type I restriction enzyme, S subunit
MVCGGALRNPPASEEALQKLASMGHPKLLVASRVGHPPKGPNVWQSPYSSDYLRAIKTWLVDLVSPRHTLSFKSDLRETSSAGRTDAEHFQTKYKELRKHLQALEQGSCLLTDVARNSDEDVDPRANPDREFKYVELADINEKLGVIESASIIRGEEAPSRARMLLRRGDVILSTVEGSLDKAALVSSDHDSAIGSTGFFVLRAKNVEPEYLLALIKSLIVREQMHCEASGTILAAVPPRALRNIVVPEIASDVRRNIAALVRESHSEQKKALQSLELAKNALEVAIEKGEDAAMALSSAPARAARRNEHGARGG